MAKKSKVITTDKEAKSPQTPSVGVGTIGEEAAGLLTPDVRDMSGNEKEFSKGEDIYQRQTQEQGLSFGGNMNANQLAQLNAVNMSNMVNQTYLVQMTKLMDQQARIIENLNLQNTRLIEKVNL